MPIDTTQICSSHHSWLLERQEHNDFVREIQQPAAEFSRASFLGKGYYVSTVGLDEQKVKNYIKNQQDQDSIMDRYDTDLVKDPFRGASKILKEDGEE